MALDIVRLTNNEPVTFQDFYGSVPYVCPPGDSIIIPFDAACTWFGDPRVSDRPTLSQYDRRGEFERVKTRAGFSVLEAQSTPWTAKNIEIASLQGERLYMVIEDPLGDKSTLQNVSSKGLDDTQAVAQELEIVKRQQAALLARLEELQHDGTKTLEDVPEDVPNKIPVSEK